MDEEAFVNQILKDRIENKLSSRKEIEEVNDKILFDIYRNYMNYGLIRSSFYLFMLSINSLKKIIDN